MALKAMAVLVVTGLIAACGLVEGDGRATQPMSDFVKSRLAAMGSSPGAPMLVRIIKQDNTLEVWKQVKDGTYKLFKSYEICAWSGDIGPKIKEGDRQSPEGFYTITPGLMNPRSNYYLAFNTGFPNKFDRVWGRTGSELMVHGDCSSRGCYAMTDQQIAEIYTLAREAFNGGQRNFELQIFPFQMTLANMVKYRNNPNIDFWWNIKQGWDAFEISHKPVPWDVCERRYVFYPEGGQLNASGACPAQSSAPKLMAQVMSEEAADKAAFKVRAADADKKEAKRLAEVAASRAAQAAADKALKERTAAVSDAVEGSTSAVGDAIGNMFSSIFGGMSSGTQPSGSSDAPVPAPASARPQ